MKDTVQRGVNQKNILTASQNPFHLVSVNVTFRHLVAKAEFSCLLFTLYVII